MSNITSPGAFYLMMREGIPPAVSEIFLVSHMETAGILIPSLGSGAQYVTKPMVIK